LNLTFREYGTGQPLIILHGLFGFSDNWKSQAKVLSNYFRVIIVDLRNHGRSEWDETHDYPSMASDVIETMKQIGIDSAHIIGHSMGGKVAMHIAQSHSKYLLKLVVVDMGIKSYPMHHQDLIHAMKNAPLNDFSARSEANNYLQKLIPEEGVRQFLLKNLFWIEKGKLAWRMNLSILEQSMNNILEALPQHGVLNSTLFVRGSNSNYILEEDLSAIEDLFLDSEFISIDGAGHWVHAEAPDVFIERTLSFLLR